jgi:hypothetical protein
LQLHELSALVLPHDVLMFYAVQVESLGKQVIKLEETLRLTTRDYILGEVQGSRQCLWGYYLLQMWLM